MEELLIILNEAEHLASQFTGGYSHRFLSAEDFHSALRNSIIELKKGNRDILKDIWLWFAPTCDWDDFIGTEGLELGNRIYVKADHLLNH